MTHGFDTADPIEERVSESPQSDLVWQMSIT
jgi:hypothetical protein